MPVRTEYDFETGESRQINTTAYRVGGALALIDEGQPVPVGAVLASSMPVSGTASVPPVVSRRQALLALLAAGKLDAVEQQMLAAPRAVQIAWQAAGTFERSSPLIEAMAPSMGLTEQDIDTLFIEAAKL